LGPEEFRAALARVPRDLRDSWIDRLFEVGELPDDGPELPRGCVPYLPCSAETVLQMIDAAKVESTDVFVDIGSGLGRAAALTHLLTGAGAIGIEIQPALVRRSRALVARLGLERVSVIEGDANALAGYMTIGSVFFLYCPFSGERLERLIGDLEAIARTRTIRVCTVDLPLPEVAWLTPVCRDRQLEVWRSAR
jgi:SAM-dependent methyltransferase